MDKLSQLVKLYASWKSTQDVDTLKVIRELLLPVTVNTGISNIRLVHTNQLQVKLLVKFHNRDWPVKVRATFHGIEVFVRGQDANGAKKQIAEAFKNNYMGV